MAKKKTKEIAELSEDIVEVEEDGEGEGLPLVPMNKSVRKIVHVELTSIPGSGILMNNPRSMFDDEEAKAQVVSTTRKRDPVKEAEGRAYRMKDGTLYVPAEAVKGCLVNSAAYKKLGKYSAKPIIAGCVQILPQQISLKTKNYDIDERTVVIRGRGRVIRARPTLDKWKLSFDLVYDTAFIQGSHLIRAMLEEGGQRVGIMDFRPAKLGSFGMFTVTKWEEKD
jgi:hypothetical protein